jgi:inhibitor of KinA
MEFAPLGDEAVLCSFPREDQAIRFAEFLRGLRPPWLVDVVAGFTRTAVFFDPECVRFADVSEWLRRLPSGPPRALPPADRRLFRVPCCYEFQKDMERIRRHTGLSADEVIRRHADGAYTAYAVGFCPGFPYLGYLAPPLAGVPRLENPRTGVEAGSIGLTGRLTGIYTEKRPAGWNIIGRTPLELVNVRDGYFPLRVGDRVRFQRIDEAEFDRLCGQRL